MKWSLIIIIGGFIIMIKLSQALSLSLFFISNSTYASNDLLIMPEIDQPTRQLYFNGLIKPALTQKKKPDGYHITLIRVQDVDPANFSELKARLEARRIEITLSFMGLLKFTPKLTSYLKLDKKTPGVLALLPQNDEQLQFRKINEILIREVADFDEEHGTKHTIHPYTQQVNYKPHVTIAQANFIEKHNINTVKVVEMINKNLGIAIKLQKFGGKVNLKAKNQIAPPGLTTKKEHAPKGVMPVQKNKKGERTKKRAELYAQKMAKLNKQQKKQPTNQTKQKNVTPEKKPEVLKNEKKENSQPSAKLLKTLIEKGDELFKQRQHEEAHRAYFSVLEQLSSNNVFFQAVQHKMESVRKIISAKASILRGNILVSEARMGEALVCFNAAMSKLDQEDPLYLEAKQAVQIIDSHEQLRLASKESLEASLKTPTVREQEPHQPKINTVQNINKSKAGKKAKSIEQQLASDKIKVACAKDLIRRLESGELNVAGKAKKRKMVNKAMQKLELANKRIAAALKQSAGLKESSAKNLPLKPLLKTEQVQSQLVQIDSVAKSYEADTKKTNVSLPSKRWADY
jgi:hypothetical protein